MTRRPRILQVGKYYPPARGGIESHLRDLCLATASEVDVDVIVASHESRVAGTAVVEGVPVRRLPTPFRIWGAPIDPALFRALRESTHDLVHLHLPHPGAVLAWLASGHRGGLVVTYHSDVIRQRWAAAAFSPLLHRLLARADAILIPTPRHVERSAILRRHRDRCRIVPFGIRTRLHGEADGSAVDALRRRFGRIVLGVGRLVYYKGFENLVAAMRTVDAHLVLVGDGPLRRSLLELARAEEVQDRVSLVGEVEDVRPYYHAAEVFVLPSVAPSEAFGLVQVEAMASGVAVVNTALDSGVPLVSIHGRTGLTVPPGDPAALACAINQLLGDPRLRGAYGQAGRERAHSHFDVEVMGRATVVVYRQVLRRRRPDGWSGGEAVN